MDRAPQTEPSASGGNGASAFQTRCLGLFFFLARRAGWLMRGLGPVFVGLAWRASPKLREDVGMNLRRVLGPSASRSDCEEKEGATAACGRAFASLPPESARPHAAVAPRTVTGHADSASEIDRVGRGVLASFYGFVLEVAANHDRPLPQLLSRIDGIEGGDAFLVERKHRRGAILVTAHFGNFEVGLAAMREKEERVHVVFQRDTMSRFEQLRHRLHQNLGILETPIDDGMASWLALREALQSDAVVMLQGDRVMPGQRGQAVPFFDGHLELPIGPAKLALMTGAPLIPVFAIRQGDGSVRVRLDEPIEVPDAGAVGPALEAVGRRIEAAVAEHPRQWHVLHRAFVEDRAEG
jgi:KDO2-lipid IV(A) lauroyltransferase